jgi:mannan polymerase II complex MNN11 subunit
MDPAVSLEARILDPAVLERSMLPGLPVVPPDSIIMTRAGMRARDVDLIISQDRKGLASGSIVLRNGEWACFFLDTWIDPLYRSYNFEKAEAHALVGLGALQQASLVGVRAADSCCL